MATSKDHPGLPFVQARGFTAGRPDGPPLWIVIHTIESSEHGAVAENIAAYFANPSDGRRVSYNYTVDNDSIVQTVDVDDSPWASGSRQGNNRGIHYGFAGRAAQTRAGWLDTYSRAMLAVAAPIMRADAQRFGIPIRRCAVADLKAMRKGFTTHNDLRLAFGGTTHTDPGDGFPWDVLFELVGGDDMPLVTDDVRKVWMTDNIVPAPDGYSAEDVKANPYWAPANILRGAHYWARYAGLKAAEVRGEVIALRTTIEKLAEVIAAGGGNVDTAAIFAGIDERLAALKTEVAAEVRDAVADFAEGGAAQVRAAK